MNPRREGLDRLVKAIGNAHPVDGLTHAFYRYPARFSPIFARAVLETFTKPGDVVLDPFMGGGTTLVEARALGRIAMGLDINSLAVFVTRAKTTLLNDADVDSLREWGRLVTEALNLRNPVEYANRWIAAGYHTNMGGRTIWPVRKTIALALDSLQCLQNGRQKRIARIVVLKTGQWALDCRSDLPTAKDFRQQLALDLDEVLAGTLQFRAAVRTVARQPKRTRLPPTLCLNRSAEGLEQNSLIRQYPPPMLILTSPPYPGVHVLY